MLSDEQWQKIADKTGCFITGGLKEAIEAEVRKQDTALIRQLVEALEHHIFLTRPPMRKQLFAWQGYGWRASHEQTNHRSCKS